MFGICQIETKITESKAVFTFRTPQQSRELAFSLPAAVWAVSSGEEPTEWSFEKGISFLFLVERSYEDLQSLFKSAEESLGAALLMGSFPFDGIAMMALDDRGEYWMDLALKWMDHPNFQFSKLLLARIEELAFRKTRNQKLRHRFLKLYARLKRDGLISETENNFNDKTKTEG